MAKRCKEATLPRSWTWIRRIPFQHEIKYELHAQIQGMRCWSQENCAPRPHCGAAVACGSIQLFRVDHFVFHQELQGEDFVDLTANMREDIILELPQRALCDRGLQGAVPALVARN
jgi:hypothetical protein